MTVDSFFLTKATKNVFVGASGAAYRNWGKLVDYNEEEYTLTLYCIGCGGPP
jgi:hypothetical protein